MSNKERVLEYIKDGYNQVEIIFGEYCVSDGINTKIINKELYEFAKTELEKRGEKDV